jgi:hypothetical protein
MKPLVAVLAAVVAVAVWSTAVDAGTDPVSGATFAPILAGQTSLDPAEFTTLIVAGAGFHSEYRRSHGGWFYNADGVWTPGFPNPLCSDGTWVEDWIGVVWVWTLDGLTVKRGRALGVLSSGGVATGGQYADPPALCPTVDVFALLAASSAPAMTRAALIAYYSDASP